MEVYLDVLIAAVYRQLCALAALVSRKIGDEGVFGNTVVHILSERQTRSERQFLFSVNEFPVSCRIIAPYSLQERVTFHPHKKEFTV